MQTQVVGTETWAKILLGVVAALNALYLILTGSLKTYLEEKVKHLATKEDLQDLVKEVREKAIANKEGEITAIQNKLDLVVEQSNKIEKSNGEIKAQISSRQRMWELKKEVIYDVVKTTGRILHLLTLYSTKLQVFEGNKGGPGASQLASELLQLSESVKVEIGQMWQHEGIIGLHFEPRVSAAVRTVGVGAASLLSSLREILLAESLKKTSEFAGKCTDVANVLRGELLREDV